jgi:hypothetical protein
MKTININKVEKLIKKIDVIPDARRNLRRLDEILQAQEKVKKATLADLQPNTRRIIMRNRMIKLAAAVVILATCIGLVGILQNGGQVAYAFEQTVEAMQGKQSFHIQTYWGSPDWRKDEYWAKFDENGELLWSRQEEWNGREKGDGPRQVTIWKENRRDRYYPKTGIQLITGIGKTEGELEEFDPEIEVKEVYGQVANGEATIEIQEPSAEERLIAITVTRSDGFYRRILLVEPDTYFVTRADRYEWTDDGGWIYIDGIEVLEYNQPFDADVFSLNLPEETITVDQVSQEVGMAQGDMSADEVASEIISEALGAWVAGDYVKASRFFGGAPTELLTERYGHLRPINIISVGQPKPIEYRKPWFIVPCKYEVERSGQIKVVEPKLNALAVDGQPGRWYVSIEPNP